MAKRPPRLPGTSWKQRETHTMRLPATSTPSGNPEGQNPILFRAQRLGDPIVVALATGEDLSRIAGPVDYASDMLEFWNLMAIRLASETAVHAITTLALWKCVEESTCGSAGNDKEPQAGRTAWR